MLTVKRITDPEAAYRLGLCFGRSICLPEEKKNLYGKCVLELLEGSKSVGLADTSHSSDVPGLLLHYLFLEKSCRSKENIRQVLRELLREAGKDTGTNTLYIHYDQKEGAKDVWNSLLSNWEGYSYKVENMWHNYLVDLAQAQNNPFLRGITLKKLQDEGTMVIPYQDVGTDILKTVSKLEQTGDQDLISLLPFGGGICDLQHSMFFLDANTKDLHGWVSVRRLTSDCAEVARYYVLPKYRGSTLNLQLAGYVIMNLAIDFKQAYFKILWGNVKMQKTIDKIFKNIALHSIRIKGTLTYADHRSSI